MSRPVTPSRAPDKPAESRQAVPQSRPRSRQTGAALVVSLLMLIAILLLGISAAQIALQGEKASRNDRDRQIAFQAAEAALMDAEMDIENSTAAASRSKIFARDSKEGFVDGCGAGTDSTYLGLCVHADDSASPVWKTVSFLDQSTNAKSVPYGRFTGQIFETGKGSLPERKPRYIIELMAYNKAGEGAGQDDITYFYRVTAIGFGTRSTTQVVLQTFYRKDGV
jgi:type IV pilus assembly protein PilX